MKLDQNEILSLLFLSTSFEKEINMKEINEFLDIYTKNGDHDDKYYFYMPMHDDFNLELFEENKENGNFKLTKNNELVQNKIRKIVYAISQEDKKIIDLIYGANKTSGRDLMQQIIWHLDGITDQLMELNGLMNSANFKNYFSGTDAMDGSNDGKRVGLSNILFKAYTGADEIKRQIKKMQEILDKPKDAFSYRIR